VKTDWRNVDRMRGKPQTPLRQTQEWCHTSFSYCSKRWRHDVTSLFSRHPALWRHGVHHVVLMTLRLITSKNRLQVTTLNHNTDIFLNQLTEFFSDNATNLHHFTQYVVLPELASQHRDRIVTTDYCIGCHATVICKRKAYATSTYWSWAEI